RDDSHLRAALSEGGRGRYGGRDDAAVLRRDLRRLDRVPDRLVPARHPVRAVMGAPSDRTASRPRGRWPRRAAIAPRRARAAELRPPAPTPRSTPRRRVSRARREPPDRLPGWAAGAAPRRAARRPEACPPKPARTPPTARWGQARRIPARSLP